MSRQIVPQKYGPTLERILGDSTVVAFDVGPDGTVYVTTARLPLDYHDLTSAGVRFTKMLPSRPQTYDVTLVKPGAAPRTITVANQQFNVHHVQPLGDELLLACARSHYRSESDIDRNGRIYSTDGSFIRDMTLGDGINSMQATSAGVIWVSYFDEGIFGNHGWETPLGASGLVAWDTYGRQEYVFNPENDLNDMADCYALNVASATDVWCYYDTGFPIVHIANRKIVGAWDSPVEGAGQLAVAGGYVLFKGGYEDAEELVLCRLPPNDEGQAQELARFRVVDSTGKPFVADRVAARGASIYFLRDKSVYSVSVELAVTAA